MAAIVWDLPYKCILIFLFGYKTIKGFNFKCILIFSPLRIFLVTLCFRGKCKEKVRPKEADTGTIGEQ